MEAASQTPDLCLLDLLMKQQTQGDPGIRLRFHEDLLQRLSLAHQPYHFCATTGNVALPLFLHSSGLNPPRPITVAAFAACGSQGTTPWRKDLNISSSEAAMLAGDAVMARVLVNIERGVPLQWAPGSFQKYPREFRMQAKEIAGALSRSAWFMLLPGPARTLVMHSVLSELSRRLVWGMLPAQLWERPLELQLSPEDLEAAQQLLAANKDQQAAAPSQTLGLPQYHFRMAAGFRRRRWGIFQAAKAVMTCAAVGLMASRHASPRRRLLMSLLGMAAGPVSSLPAAALLLLNVLESHL